MSDHHVVVMVTTSYPRFPGDGVGSFMEPIAKGVAARGHDVHVVAPWHPAIRRDAIEDGVRFHFFRYAPTTALHVFGYAAGLHADTSLKAASWMIAPIAVASGWRMARRVARERRATVMHGHWVIPGGVIASLAMPRLPLVVSLHGSDVFVAERHAVLGRAARAVFARAGGVTAPSEDLRQRAIALGAAASRSVVVPYGVDTDRFAPSPEARRSVRDALGIGERPLVVAAGRLVRKKGFNVLIDAAALLAKTLPDLVVVIAGDGDLRADLDAQVAESRLSNVRLVGNRSQSDVAQLFAAADVVAVPSIRDDAGNVDGLPNSALEALATATPVVASMAGGLPQAIADGVNGRLVLERDAARLAQAIAELLSAPDRSRAMGAAARLRVIRDNGWDRVADAMCTAYDHAIAPGTAR